VARPTLQDGGGQYTIKASFSAIDADSRNGVSLRGRKIERLPWRRIEGARGTMELRGRLSLRGLRRGGGSHIVGLLERNLGERRGEKEVFLLMLAFRRGRSLRLGILIRMRIRIRGRRAALISSIRRRVCRV
jgi:hypothetical protein